MSRRERMLDNESSVVELMSRTLQGRFFMAPTAEARDIIVGIVGRGQRLYGVEIYAFIFLSNHFHMLVRVDSAKQMADFTGYIKSNIARELGRACRWSGAFWWGRYHSGSLADGSEQTLTARFRYILLNGCKENLVASPLEWPGASTAGALYRGEWKMTGTWYDRTAEGHARRARKPQRFPHKETVRLSPLPSVADLPPEEQRQFVVDMVHEIEKETRERHERAGTRPLGVQKLLRLNPLEKPKEFRSKPSPLFYASSREEYHARLEVRVAKTLAYREAADRLRKGEKDVEFPVGTFPARAPFVESTAPP